MDARRLGVAGLLLSLRPMTSPTLLRRTLLAALPAVGILAGVAGGVRPVRAEDPEQVAARERCATRLSVALHGKSAPADLLGSPDPQAKVDAMLGAPDFVERFARFTNAEMNPSPGSSPAADAVYFVARHVLENGRPWKDLFVGAFDLEVSEDGQEVSVRASPDGLGYFRTQAWLRRYAGNEEDGYRISAAYRILRNTVGLELTAVTTAPDTDLSAAGRQAAACKSCHYDGWYALDKVARVLSRRVGTGDEMTFRPPEEGPQEILDGARISDDRQLVEALVASEAFRFRACRLAFRYVTGRDENVCEGRLFDACMKEFQAKGTIQSAVAVFAKAPSTCH